MGIAERKQRQKEEVRTSILQAAWQLVEQEGWQALSIRKIADAIEYSVPVIYAHFQNKEAILLEFTKEGFRLLAREVKQAKELHHRPDQQLKAISEAYWHFAFSHKEYYQLMFGLGIPACDTVRQVSEMQLFSDVLISVIQEALSNNQEIETDYMLKFHTFWSILHGLISIQMINRNATATDWNRLVLQDAVAGFIKTLE